MAALRHPRRPVRASARAVRLALSTMAIFRAGEAARSNSINACSASGCVSSANGRMTAFYAGGWFVKSLTFPSKHFTRCEAAAARDVPRSNVTASSGIP